LEGAERVLEGMRDEPRGLLKITVPIDLAERVGELVDDFLTRYREVRVATHISNARVDLVCEGYDLALRAGELSDSTLVARKLADSTLHLAASPGYFKRRGVPKLLSELSEHECLIFGTSSVAATWQLTGPTGPEVVRVSGSIAANDLGFLRQAAINGRGIGRFPSQHIKNQVEQGTLVRALPNYCGLSPALYLVYPSASYLSPKVRRFIELCVEHKDSWFG
jgi:DNA-binding transcriptional LysR family regulator